MKSMISLSVVVAMLMAGSTFAVVTSLGEDDLVAAPFRGEEGTTAQAWYFDEFTGTTGIAPDIADSPGAPVVDMIGGFLDNTVYLKTDYDQTGVWIVDAGREGQGFERTSEMRIFVPNIEQQNPIKKIWLQVTYYAQEGKEPNVYVLPEGDDTQPVPKMELVGDPTQVGEMYYHAVFELELPFNPFWEYIYIRPRDCQVYVDSVIVETQCIPEPWTMGLLGLGGLFLRRRR